MASRDLVMEGGLVIPASELDLTFSRASGAGGQNVNKVNSRVELRFDLSATRSLPPDVVERLERLAGKRVSDDGILRIVSQTSRDQARNIELGYERLAALIAEARIRPEPRVPTRPSRSSQRRRLADKRARGEIKAARRRSGDEG